MASINNGKTVAVQATVIPNRTLSKTFSMETNSASTLDCQAHFLKSRFALSWPVARLVAELAFGEQGVSA